ncbi:MAG: hypothetical protein AB7Y74_12120 [Syntrophorhabdus sp.]
MEKFFAIWIGAYAFVTLVVIVLMGKKNNKLNLTKFTIVAGIILAVTLGVILYFGMRIQISNLISN